MAAKPLTLRVPSEGATLLAELTAISGASAEEYIVYVLPGILAEARAAVERDPSIRERVPNPA